MRVMRTSPLGNVATRKRVARDRDVVVGEDTRARHREYWLERHEERPGAERAREEYGNLAAAAETEEPDPGHQHRDGESGCRQVAHRIGARLTPGHDMMRCAASRTAKSSATKNSSSR
jgi:hypothetical protein